MNKIHIEKIHEVDNPIYLIVLEVEFTRDADAAPIKWEKKSIPIEKIEEFYYDEGLDQRELLGPPHLDASYDKVWTVDFWDEVEDGYLEDFVKDYLTEILK